MDTYTITNEESTVDVKPILLAELEHGVTNQSSIISHGAIWTSILATDRGHLQTNLIAKGKRKRK